MPRRLTPLAALALGACATTVPGPDRTVPEVSVGVLERAGTEVTSLDPTMRQIGWPTGGKLRLEAWGRDHESGVAGTTLRATLRVTCRSPSGLTVIRETTRERENAERDRPAKRNAAVDFDLAGDLNRFCPDSRYDGAEIVATGSAVNGVGMEAVTPELRIVLLAPSS